jgi:NHS family xanthosine MFS transporter
MMMTNGFGAVLGSFTSGWAIDKYFTKSFSNTTDLAAYLQTEPTNGLMNEFVKGHGVEISADGLFSNPIFMKDWHHIWLTFAAYALIIAIAFALMFKHKHDPKDVQNIGH